MIDLIKNNKILILAISGITLFLVAISFIIIMFSTPKNNKELNQKEKTLQSLIQNETKRRDILLKNVLVESEGWSIAQININNQRDNNSVVVVKGNKIQLGPGTSFTIEDLYKINAPNKIISYFYPEKTHWIGFNNDFNKNFRFPDRIKSTITSFAISSNIDATKIERLSNIEHRTANTDTDFIDYFSFKMSINDKIYLFEANTSTVNFQTTCTIKSEDGKNILFQQAVRG